MKPYLLILGAAWLCSDKSRHRFVVPTAEICLQRETPLFESIEVDDICDLFAVIQSKAKGTTTSQGSKSTSGARQSECAERSRVRLGVRTRGTGGSSPLKCVAHN